MSLRPGLEPSALRGIGMALRLTALSFLAAGFLWLVMTLATKADPELGGYERARIEPLPPLPDPTGCYITEEEMGP